MNSILSRLTSPADLRSLSWDQLNELARQIRQRIIEVVSRSGGHLASNLGVTELTIALHYVYDFSQDRLLWDVGHQCYPHKLLTGRAEQFDTLRKEGGLSGFPNIDESPYDVFSVGHAGTAIPTAVGLARGYAAHQVNRRVVAVVGDASIVNGLAFEGLNQAGLLRRQLLIVLNDNSMGIAPTQGGLAQHLARLRTSEFYEEVRRQTRKYLPRVPIVGRAALEALEHLKQGIKATLAPHQIFEQLGLLYVGPIDGHDLPHLIELLQMLRDVPSPVLLHVHTEKGRGVEWAESDPTAFHSPGPFRIEQGKVQIDNGTGKSWTDAFADALMTCARQDERVVALTAAMPDGTGTAKFAQAFPHRFLDCGIAESCTVDIAAGLCKAGLRPVTAIYSTFLQRAFDQIFQEVALQRLPVIFALDRAGLVGGDGAVHHGFLDIAYLRGLQGMVLMAPADEAELLAALRFALSLGGPCAIRYPRDRVPPPLPGVCPPFVLGQSRVVREGKSATVVGYGSTVTAALQAADNLLAEGIDLRVINARFAKPMDTAMLTDVLSSGQLVVTVEDHSLAGGFGSAVLETAADLGLPTDSIVRLGLPTDRFIAHASRAAQLAEVGIDAAGIARAIRLRLGRPRSESSPRSASGQPILRRHDLLT